MILDGYNRIARIGNDGWMICRPFTRHERPAIREQVSAIPEPLAKQVLCDLAESRIVRRDFDVPLEAMPDELLKQVLAAALGEGQDEQEVADEQNLSDGVYLVARYPWLEATSCRQCRRWWWDPHTGVLHRQGDGPAGEPLLRPEGMPVSCEDDPPSCPKGHWSNQATLSPQNRQAYQHYTLAAAAGCPDPNDPILRRNWRLIEGALDRARAAAERHGGRQGGSRNGREHRHAARGVAPG